MSKVKFGDVVREVKKKIDRNNNPYEHYVAGHHMDTEDLRIRRRGRFDTDDVGPAFIRLFTKGQILYGSRRTYLKKVAVADFDGVTANTTFVLETKNEQVLRHRLIPFIMLSEGFTQWSIMKSKGSTNPYVLFSDLAGYEFELPSIEQQDKLVELLWGFVELQDAYNALLKQTDELVKSQFIEQFGDKKTSHLQHISLLITDGTHQPPVFEKSGIPFILVSNLIENKITYDTSKYISEASYDTLIKRTPIEKGDILLTTVGSYGHPAIVTSPKRFCFQRHIAYIKPNKELINSIFLHQAILSPMVQEQIEKVVLGVAQKTLNLSAIRKLEIPLPCLQEQEAFAEFIQQLDKSKFELEQALSELTLTYKRILAENLG